MFDTDTKTATIDRDSRSEPSRETVNISVVSSSESDKSGIRGKRVLWILVALAVAALVGGMIATLTYSAPEVENTLEQQPAIGPAVGSQRFLSRLAAQGYIPRQAVDEYRLLVEQAVAQGHVPAASLEPAKANIDPLYSSYEMRLMDAVRSGHIPKETLDTDTFLLKRLANEGQIPRAAAP